MAHNDHNLHSVRDDDDDVGKPGRTLTKADVDAIVDALHARVTSNFYRDLGKGVWRIFWVAVVSIIVAVAAFGHFNITVGPK